MNHRMNPHKRESAAHPSEGDIRAYLDGELTSVASIRLALHVRRCASCARAAGELRALDGQASALLRDFMPAARASTPGRARTIGLAVATVLGGAAAVAIWVTAVPATHARASGAYRVHDVCCFNLDGGDHADDGMLTVSRPGEVVDCVLLYEDRAGLRRFAQRDPLRFAGAGTVASVCAPELLADVQASLAMVGRGS